MFEIKYIRIVAPHEKWAQENYIDVELDKIANSDLGIERPDEMPCTMIIEGRAVRTYSQSQMSSSQKIRGKNDSRWGMAPGWLVRDVEDPYLLRCADSGIRSDDLGFGSERKVGEEAEKILALKRAGVTANLTTKAGLIDFITNSILGATEPNECHLLLRNNIIGITIDPNAEPQNLAEAIKMRDAYQNRFGVSLPFHTYQSNLGHLEEVSEESLRIRIQEMDAFEDLKKLLKYGVYSCDENFGKIVFLNINNDEKSKIDALLEMAGSNLRVSFNEEENRCEMAARPSQIVHQLQQKAVDQAALLCDEIFNPLFVSRRTEISPLENNPAIISVRFISDEASEDVVKRRMSAINSSRLRLGLDSEKFNIKISETAFEIDVNFLIKKAPLIAEKFTSAYGEVIDRLKSEYHPPEPSSGMGANTVWRLGGAASNKFSLQVIP